MNWTRPATSLKANPPLFDGTTPATGTLSVSFTDAFPPAGTVTLDLSSATECAGPDPSVWATANVAGADHCSGD
ncbi:MAG: hypothetical protein ABI349_05595 [Casimicrobiaceae bacterium]